MQAIFPQGLLLRSLIIIIFPFLLIQSLTIFVFLQNERDKITEQLTQELVRELSLVVAIFESNPPQKYDDLVKIISEALEVQVSYAQDNHSSQNINGIFFDVIDDDINAIISKKIKSPYFINTIGTSNWIEIGIRLANGYNIRVLAQQGRIDLTSTFTFVTLIFILSLCLLIIAGFLIGNQIRPIVSLSNAMHQFGRGQKIPSNFRVGGASEVRQAFTAFMKMKTRIERQLEERSNFLAGISHDLRTIVTRFRLQISMLKDTHSREALESDVEVMQKMIESYLNFIRSDTQEQTQETNLLYFMQEIIDFMQIAGKEIHVFEEQQCLLKIRPLSIKRALMNVVSNAIRHADIIHITITADESYAFVKIEDNGEGIAEESYQDVFRPFFRLDKARNLDYSGSGLGLSIARDAVLGHGGDIRLDKSSHLGGLLVMISFPR